jgi:hypothetical protein
MRAARLHLHIWPMSTTETALTAHLVMPSGHPGDEFCNRSLRLIPDVRIVFWLPTVAPESQHKIRISLAFADPVRGGDGQCWATFIQCLCL